MTPKEYLSKIILLDQRIETNLESIERLKARAASVTSKLSDDKGGETNSLHDFTDTVAKVLAMEEKVNQEIDQLVDLKSKITKEINGMDNKIYAVLLLKRYVLGRSLLEIATDMSYSYPRVRHMHGEALEDFKKTYPEIFTAHVSTQ